VVTVSAPLPTLPRKDVRSTAHIGSAQPRESRRLACRTPPDSHLPPKNHHVGTRGSLSASNPPFTVRSAAAVGTRGSPLGSNPPFVVVRGGPDASPSGGQLRRLPACE
jgi:hypothetical protein